MDTEELGNVPPDPAPAGAAAPVDPIRRMVIPDHQLLRPIGRGSYGEVWLARHSLGTYRAVKIVSRRAFSHDKPFLREFSGIQRFEPVSRSHEGFIDILHVGINEAEEYFYYIMELGDDLYAGQSIDPDRYVPKTLSRVIAASGSLPLADCIQCGLVLTRALDALHEHKLVHRDIKPSNILFVNGVPKLADIGLVAEVETARSYVGTEGFIPPEGPGSPPADVYSLGKVLYEASTGMDRQDFPELPPHFEQTPDYEKFIELNEIILQACQNETRNRYATARAMHADLLVLEHGKSIKRLKALERQLRGIKSAARIGLVGALALAGLAYPVYREYRTAIEERQRRVGADIVRGNSAADAGDFAGALPFFADALRVDESDRARVRDHRVRFGSSLALCPKLTRAWSGDQQAVGVQFNPSADEVMVARRYGALEFYNFTADKPFATFNPHRWLLWASYSPDGQTVATAGEDSTARLWSWNPPQLQLRFTLPHPNFVYSVAFSQDGLRLLTGCHDGLARIYDTRTGKLELTLSRHKDIVAFAAFSPDGNLVVTCGRDNTARVWDAHTGHALGPPLAHKDWVVHASFSPDSRRLATACLDHTAQVWEVGEPCRRLRPDLLHDDCVFSVAFSPDSRLIISGSLDGTVRFWSAATFQPVSGNPLLRHRDRVLQASLDATGRRVLAGCTDGTVQVWDLAGARAPQPLANAVVSPNGERVAVMATNSAAVLRTSDDKPTCPPIELPARIDGLEFSGNGRFLACSSKVLDTTNAASRLEVWDTDRGERVAAPLTITNRLVGSCPSEDGRRLLVFGDRFVQGWDVLAQLPLAPALQTTGTVKTAFLNHGGSRFAVCGGRQVSVCDAATGKPLFPPLEHNTTVQMAQFSPNDASLLTFCTDGALTPCAAQVFDATTGRPLGPPLRHGDGVLHASFSASGRRIITAGEDFCAAIWETRTGRQLLPGIRHKDRVSAAGFSPDGQWIATGSFDKTLHLWSATTGEALSPAFDFLAYPRSIAFSPDGRRLVVSGGARRACLVNIPREDRPLEDLIALGRLLTGDRIAGSPLAASATNTTPSSLWATLRAKYPAQFAVSSEDIVAWHESIASTSELQKEWAQAEFHLEQLLRLKPNDPALADRLAKARAGLAATR